MVLWAISALIIVILIIILFLATFSALLSCSWWYRDWNVRNYFLKQVCFYTHDKMRWGVLVIGWLYMVVCNKGTSQSLAARIPAGLQGIKCLCHSIKCTPCIFDCHSVYYHNEGVGGGGETKNKNLPKKLGICNRIAKKKPKTQKTKQTKQNKNPNKQISALSPLWFSGSYGS